MHRVLLCTLEAVEGELCLLEVLEVLEVMLDTPYAGGCGGFEISIVAVFSFQSAAPPKARHHESPPEQPFARGRPLSFREAPAPTRKYHNILHQLPADVQSPLRSSTGFRPDTMPILKLVR